jgi:osmotically-inducible protein OsmY
VPVEHVEVIVSTGWMTLRGDVEWEYQRRAGERAVRKLAEVTAVEKRIVVAPGTQRAAGRSCPAGETDSPQPDRR